MKELIEYIGKNISLSNEIINDLKAISIERNGEAMKEHIEENIGAAQIIKSPPF